MSRRNNKNETSDIVKGIVLPMWLRTLIAVGVVLLFMLVLFRVQTFEVSGNVRYTSDEVADASGITPGDILIGVNKTRIASRLMTKLPYIEKVVVRKRLPGTIVLEVEECTAAAACMSEFGDYWLINTDGKLLEELKTRDPEEIKVPVIVGQLIQLPKAGDIAVFQDTKLGEQTMEMVRSLVAGNFCNTITEIGVSEPENIYLVYQNNIEVRFGDGTDFDYRLQYMKQAIGALENGARGSLDLRFEAGNQAVFHPVEAK